MHGEGRLFFTLLLKGKEYMNERLAKAVSVSCLTESQWDRILQRRYIERGDLKIELQGGRTYFRNIELPVTDTQNNALYLLSREEKYLTFEQLYTNVFAPEYEMTFIEPTAVPDKTEKPPERNEARTIMENLTATVNNYCKGEIWIEFEPDKGYIMRIASTINNNGTKSGEDN